MTDKERKQEATDEEVQDLEASEQDAEQVNGGYATMLSNLANMRHEELKTIANNLRA